MLEERIKEQIRHNPAFLKELEAPDEELMLFAVNSAWNNLKYFREPTPGVRMAALNNKGWAIQYIRDPSQAEKLAAVERDADAIQYIPEADCAVQTAAVNNSWRAIRHIVKPCREARLLAVAQNEQAIVYISDYSQEDLAEYLKLNISIVKYLYDSLDLEELSTILREVFAGDPTEEYLRAYMELEILDVDKIAFIGEVGSKSVKKKLVDYWLGR